MSSRAVRALRGDVGIPDILGAVSEADDEGDESDDDDEPIVVQRPAAFALMDDSSESDSEAEEESDADASAAKDVSAPAFPAEKNLNEQERPENEDEDDAKPAAVEENLDALIDEFREKDETDPATSRSNRDTATEVPLPTCPFDAILSNMDSRDLDYDYCMRTSLLLNNDNNNNNNNNGEGDSTTNRGRQPTRHKATPLFGSKRDGWVRPPRFVGGGLGMTTYDRNDNNNARILPWPYRTEFSAAATPLSQWCTFVQSDSYQRDCDDFSRVIRQSGDVNALTLFVAHHPYVTTALLQLTTVLYQTNHSQQGYELLQRCLWIYESSSLVAFVQNLQQPQQRPKKTFLMDYDQTENQPFFDALFKLVHVSSIAGLSRTCLASSRLLLSLDPLRDPKGILLILDKHALTTCRGGNVADEVKLLQWLIQLVESKTVVLCHRDDDNGQTYRCGLLELPNWSYSYALALFLLHQASELTAVELTEMDAAYETIQHKANVAIQNAMRRYPLVVELLLKQLEADTTGRSFRRDWVTVLDFCRDHARKLARHWHGSQSSNDETVALSATMQACDLIIQIFVQQNAPLWGNDDVQQWVYDNLKELQQQQQQHQQPSPLTEASAGNTAEASNNSNDRVPPVQQQQQQQQLPSCPNPALMRYGGVDPADYDTKIQTLPPEAALIDPGLVAHALAVDPNRRRLVRNRGRGGGPAGEQQPEDAFRMVDALHGGGPAAAAAAARRPLLGPPTQHVDPDWPLLEVFWRSFLPWNHVDGVPPPRR